MSESPDTRSFTFMCRDHPLHQLMKPLYRSLLKLFVNAVGFALDVLVQTDASAPVGQDSVGLTLPPADKSASVHEVSV